MLFPPLVVLPSLDTMMIVCPPPPPAGAAATGVNTRLVHDKDGYAGLIDGEWDWYDGDLYVNIGTEPAVANQLFPTPHECYVSVSTDDGWREDAWTHLSFSNDIVLNNSTIKDVHGNDADITAVLNFLYEFPVGTLSIPFTFSAPYEFADADGFAI